MLTWLVASAAALGAQAQAGPELSLTWQAGPGCPEKSWALSALRDRLGRNLTEGDDAELAVRANLRRNGSGFALALETRRQAERGERSLQAPRCEVLAQTAVLVIALALEDQQESHSAPTDPARAAPGPAQASPEPAPSQPPPPNAPNASRFALRAAAMMDAGFLPGVGLGPEAAFVFNRGPFSAQLAGFFLPGRSSQPREDGQVSVSLWGVRPMGCGRVFGGAVSLDLCTGMEFGRVTGEGSGDLAESRRRSWLYRSAWASVQMIFVPVAGWEFFVAPGVSVPLGRPQFVSETSATGTRTELHTPAPVAARLALGVGRTF